MYIWTETSSIQQSESGASDANLVIVVPALAQLEGRAEVLHTVKDVYGLVLRSVREIVSAVTPSSMNYRRLGVRRVTVVFQIGETKHHVGWLSATPIRPSTSSHRGVGPQLLCTSRMSAHVVEVPSRYGHGRSRR